ncbi:MAG: AI-2E family transporter [Proteobacteria bacterium]|nr:AI-2E family transporter [Pseudomonadota bacterium]
MHAFLPPWIKFIIAFILLAGIGWFLSTIATLVKLFIIATLFAYIMNPLVNYFESKGLSRTSSTSIIFLGVVSGLVLFVFLLLPNISRELVSIQNSLSSGKATDYIVMLEVKLEQATRFLGIKNLDIMEKLKGFAAVTGDGIVGYFVDSVSLLLNLILIPFFLFFLLKDGRDFSKRLIESFPNRYFEFCLNLINKMDIQLGHYVRGQFTESAIIAFIAFFVLSLLGVKNAFVLGVFVGVTNLIPYLGPLVGAIPPVVIASLDTGGMKAALVVSLSLLAIQVIDSIVLKPLIVSKSIDMHPLSVLLIVIVGGKFFGVLGMLLSVPIMASVKLIMFEGTMLWRRYRFA